MISTQHGTVEATDLFENASELLDQIQELKNVNAQLRTQLEHIVTADPLSLQSEIAALTVERDARLAYWKRVRLAFQTQQALDAEWVAVPVRAVQLVTLPDNGLPGPAF